MPTVVDSVPQELREEVDAAIAWLSRERGRRFALTGLVEPTNAVASRQRNGVATPLELELILCADDVCVREKVRVWHSDARIHVDLVDEGSTLDPPAEVDPVPGVRRDWLDRQLAAYEFVVLVFYRGFW